MKKRDEAKTDRTAMVAQAEGALNPFKDQKFRDSMKTVLGVSKMNVGKKLGKVRERG